MKLSPEFKPITHCPSGHDLAVHGTVTLGIMRCNACHAANMRKRMKDKPMSVWASRRKKATHDHA